MNEPRETAAKVVVTQMKPREARAWAPVARTKSIRNTKRLLRNTSVFAAVCLCLGAGGYLALRHPQDTKMVMSHVSGGFEYGESLGRLQFVSNILPESAMVFLTSSTAIPEMIEPAAVSASHVWTQEEPWLEYPLVGDVYACQDGEIMTIVKNRQDEYTVRMLHANGYESIYSGLSAVHWDENAAVNAGDQLGTATGFTAFELRKDGLSVLPVFSDI